MQRLISEASSCSDIQEFRILWHQMIYYCNNISPPLDPILSQMNPVHNTQSYFSNIHFNIILEHTTISLRLLHLNTTCVPLQLRVY
jgi:hypothetical protein